jgi:hypothetical protein
LFAFYFIRFEFNSIKKSIAYFATLYINNLKNYIIMETSRKDSKSGMKDSGKTQKSTTDSRGKKGNAKSTDSKGRAH